jgi:hypothetical protein
MRVNLNDVSRSTAGRSASGPLPIEAPAGTPVPPALSSALAGAPTLVGSFGVADLARAFETLNIADIDPGPNGEVVLQWIDSKHPDERLAVSTLPLLLALGRDLKLLGRARSLELL